MRKDLFRYGVLQPFAESVAEDIGDTQNVVIGAVVPLAHVCGVALVAVVAMVCSFGVHFPCGLILLTQMSRRSPFTVT